MGKTIDTISNFAAPVAGFMAGGPIGAAAAGGSYLGSNIGGAMFPSAGNVGGALNTAMGGGAVSNLIGNTLPAELANVGLGSALGGYFGGNAASSLAPQKNANATGEGMTSAPFNPSQANAATLPLSLQTLGGLTSNQQATNIANKGVYGGGLGPEEQSYFLNLQNRKLVDPQGQVGSMSSLQPIEQSYLQQLGLGGNSDPTSLLQAMSKWKPS